MSTRLACQNTLKMYSFQAKMSQKPSEIHAVEKVELKIIDKEEEKPKPKNHLSRFQSKIAQDISSLAILKKREKQCEKKIPRKVETKNEKLKYLARTLKSKNQAQKLDLDFEW